MHAMSKGKPTPKRFQVQRIKNSHTSEEGCLIHKSRSKPLAAAHASSHDAASVMPNAMTGVLRDISTICGQLKHGINQVRTHHRLVCEYQSKTATS